MACANAPYLAQTPYLLRLIGSITPNSFRQQLYSDLPAQIRLGVLSEGLHSNTMFSVDEAGALIYRL